MSPHPRLDGFSSASSTSLTRTSATPYLVLLSKTGVFLAVAFFCTLHGVAATSADFALLRNQWRNELTGGVLTAAELTDVRIIEARDRIMRKASDYVAMLDKTASRSALWHDGLEQTATAKSSAIQGSYERVVVMAQAYAMNDTPYDAAQRAALGETIKDCMAWLHANWYAPSKVTTTPPRFASPGPWPRGYDWAAMQMFIPDAINSVLALARDLFTTDQIKAYTDAIMVYNADLEYGGYSGNTLMTGGNLAQKCKVFTLCGANAENEAYLDTMRVKLSAFFDYANGTGYPDRNKPWAGDGGFYRDGSFLQHYDHSYVGQYGLEAFTAIGELGIILRGSTIWPIDDYPNFSNLFSFIQQSVGPFLYRGAMMDMTRGRFIQGSPKTRDHNAGQRMMRTLSQIAEIASPADAALLCSQIQSWERAATQPPFNFSAYTSATVSQVRRLDAVLRGTAAALSEPELSRVYPIMDQVVHLRPGFGFAVAMYSNHISAYETLGRQNLGGWHLNAGQTYLYNCDLAHYSDSYWATVDKYRLPGTTIDTERLGVNDHADETSPCHEVGGVSLLDQFSVAGMRYDSPSSTLGAKKAWFMFDDEVVALGADITSTDSLKVETTLDNRRIKDDRSNVVTADGTALTFGSAPIVVSASWLHLKGNYSGISPYADGESDIGYYFPVPTALNVIKEERTSDWSIVTKSYKDTKTLFPTVDTFVRDGTNAESSYTEADNLEVKSANTGYNRETLLKFDLKGLSDIESAKFFVTGKSTVSGTDIVVNVRGLTDDAWNGAVAWNVRPTESGGDCGSFTSLPEVGTNYVEDEKLTSFLKSQTTQQGGDGIASLRLQADTYNALYSAASVDRVSRSGFSATPGVTIPSLSLVMNPQCKDSFATFWIDHGANPTAQSYCYVILPERVADAVKYYAEHPDIEILRNDGIAQGVKEITQRATGAVFWTDTSAGVGLITTSRKSAVMVRESTGATPALDVSVADLTETNTGMIEVTLARSATTYTLGADITAGTVTVQQVTPWIKYSVNVNNSQGRGFPVQFQGVAPVVLSPTKDAYVRDGTYANTNYGGSSTLFSTTASTNYSKRTYLQFDVGAFRDVEKATLRLYGRNSQGTSALQVKAFGAELSTWIEAGTGGITWNNMPAIESVTPLAITTVTDALGYYEWDVTRFIRAQIRAGVSQITLVLVGDARNFQANSREASNNQPQLVLQ